MTCVFCKADGPLTAEHVFPDWSKPYVSDDSGPGTQTRTIIHAGEPTSHSYRTNAANVTVRAVCASCNSGWMSHLEHAAKPLLVPMVVGQESVVLSADEQAVVATWCVKTSLVAGAKFTPATPERFYERLYDSRAVGPTDRVWIGRTAGQQFTYLDHRPLKVRPVEEPEPAVENAYATTLALGHLAAYVVGRLDAEPDTDKVVDQLGAGLLQIWPPSDPLLWPPAGTFTITGLDALADVVAGPALA
jgi:hypothetical protein